MRVCGRLANVFSGPKTVHRDAFFFSFPSLPPYTGFFPIQQFGGTTADRDEEGEEEGDRTHGDRNPFSKGESPPFDSARLQPGGRWNRARLERRTVGNANGDVAVHHGCIAKAETPTVTGNTRLEPRSRSGTDAGFFEGSLTEPRPLIPVSPRGRRPRRPQSNASVRWSPDPAGSPFRRPQRFENQSLYKRAFQFHPDAGSAGQ